ncbi:MAG: SagB/ThcOx family dehydrogenase [Bacteroidaceae bacterium]|nr:SagB/ThcOx family dehydrogenase [Bacteroidaceae bacterium]MDO4994016.1 SagB/ThcOx family dehydrogenase [Bacteroidales bacterium]
MRKYLTLAVALLMAGSSVAQDDIKLPAPNKDVKMTLMDALQQRTSVREYSDKAVDDATLSQVLWAACGINRPESKKITAASAINAQDILVYVVRAEGAWLFMPETNVLHKVCDKDLRDDVAGFQKFAATAPVSLVLVSDKAKFGNRSRGSDQLAAMDSGYVSENIYLVCTALGLGTVARATMNHEVLSRELGLTDQQVPLLNHPIGWLK